jgi:hypothetical protein
MGTEQTEQCEVTLCAQCGFFHMTDAQIDAAARRFPA